MSAEIKVQDLVAWRTDDGRQLVVVVQLDGDHAEVTPNTQFGESKLMVAPPPTTRVSLSELEPLSEEQISEALRSRRLD